MVEGRPVSRAVVVAWIKVVYDLSPASYESDNGDSDDSESDEDGEGAEADALSLLLFADAVGSSSRVMRGCYDSCSGQFDSIHVDLDGECVELQLDGRGYATDSNNLVEATMTGEREIPLSASAAAAVHELGPKAAAQLEPMLHLAYRLGLEELQEKLHAVIFGNAVFSDSIFSEDTVPSILTDRVMAAVPKAGLRDAWWDHITRKACLKSRHSALFGKAEDSAPIPTELVLGQPLLGTPAGTKLRVKIDLQDGTIVREADKELCLNCSLVVGNV
jgi:hypothetical protein